jgi:hypothetical protein
MAQTKTSNKKAAKRSTSNSRKAPTSRRRSSSSAKRRSGSKSPSSASRSSGNGSSSGVQAVRDTVAEVGHKAGHATSETASKAGQAASKAKVPLIAGGAALAGAVASGVALSAARSKKGKVLGVKMPKTKMKFETKDLVKTADRVASAGEQIGRVSAGVRRGTNSSNGADDHRSPIEVLIQGLTRRR